MRRRIWILVAAFALVAMPSPAVAAPVFHRLPPVAGFPVPAPPQVSAESWILYDATYDVTLASHEADAERPMASTTKIMTALVALERSDPDELVTVSARAAAVGEAEIGLVPGEQFLLRTLLTTMLVRSANDAAVAVAEHVGGDVETFVELMNAKAAELGLEHTHFVNPHGLDAPGHYSSARDLLTMARTAMQNPEFLRPAPDGAERVAESTNRLLTSYQGAIGVKTGFTGGAGLVLVAAAEREGRRLYVVVMGSEGPGAHFADASALLDYGFERLGLVPTLMSGELPIAEIDDEVLTEGMLEALAHTGGVTVRAPEVTEALPTLTEASPGRTTVSRRGEPPIDLTQALGWVVRYWKWLLGDG